MARDADNAEVYLIPNNFIDESRLFNGMVRTRNFVEAVVVLLCIGIPCGMFIPSDFEAKFGVMAIAAGLPAFITLAGINGDSVIRFIRLALNWKKTAQVMLYNDNARTYHARPLEVMMSEDTASDIVAKQLDDWRAKRAERDANIEYIEGVDFVFSDDDEYQRMMPKEMREQLRREEKQKNSKKSQKPKNNQIKALPVASDPATSPDDCHFEPVKTNDTDAKIASDTPVATELPAQDERDATETELRLDADALTPEQTSQDVSPEPLEFAFTEESASEEISFVETSAGESAADVFTFDDTEAVEVVEDPQSGPNKETDADTARI